MKTQEQFSYSDLCNLLGSTLGKPETNADGKAYTWTFTPKPIQFTATVNLPPMAEVRRTILDVMAEKKE